MIFTINCNAATNNGSVNCDNSGKVDVTTCLQELINKDATVVLESGSYLITQPLELRSNRSIIGHSTMIVPKFIKPYLGAFSGESVKDVNIKGLNISVNGYFSEHLRANPYIFTLKTLYYVGFNNLTTGILITGNSSNVSIIECQISGVDFGILISGRYSESTNSIDNVRVLNTTMKNVGEAGLRLLYVSNAKIENNVIDHVSGNFVISDTPKLVDAKFADGIYMQGVRDITIKNNSISNVKRIGIVLEGVLDKTNKVKMMNDKVAIVNNNISNVNGSRGTEFNAGIWVEPYVNSESTNYYKTKNVIIEGNMIDNKGAMRGSNAQWGIRLGGVENIVKNNTIKNFSNLDSVAIVYSYGLTKIESNVCVNNSRDFMQNSDNKEHSKFILVNNNYGVNKCKN